MADDVQELSSEGGRVNPATPPAALTPEPPPPLRPPPRPAAQTAAAASKKETEYVILRGESKDGPFEKLPDTETTQGQTNAKRAAAAKDENPENYFYTAVPATSFRPQKPIIQITFPTDDGDD